MKELFDAIQNSRHKKLIILLLIVFILAVNLIEPLHILSGDANVVSGLEFFRGIAIIGTLFASICIFGLQSSNQPNHNNKYGCIVWLFQLSLTIYSPFLLQDIFGHFTDKILWSETFDEISEVREKKERVWYHRATKNYQYYLYVNSRITNNQLSLTSKGIYDSISKHDTIIINISKRNHNMWRVKKIHPTAVEVKELYIRQKLMNRGTPPIIAYDEYSVKNMDSLLFDSHCQVGTVYAKADDEHYRHIVKVGVDSLHTTTHEFIGRATVYQRLNIGDKVILQVSDSLPEINRVINWQPTEAEIMQYQQPQPFDEKMIVKDYSRCTKEFEIENLHKSHKRIGIIYDKYEDDYVGAYLEVGIDEKHTRTHLFHTYNESEMKIYNEASIGDTVLVRVSDALPQLNRVLNWQPTPEEKKKYKTPVRLMELAD